MTSIYMFIIEIDGKDKIKLEKHNNKQTKTMSDKAEEYYMGNYRSAHNVMDKSNRKLQQFDFYDMTDFAEAYAAEQKKELLEKIEEALIIKEYPHLAPPPKSLLGRVADIKSGRVAQIEIIQKAIDKLK